ncbi:50S ribosomal protein L4 [Candidatus Babeliales bacterium]|nr:50S ribosomal protein L4 [Candidatus Babeliales bacterium]
MRTNIRLYSAEKENSGSLGLDLVVDKAQDLNDRTYACSVRVLLQNGRQSTSCTKTRGEVSFTNKKPWKQKGTGRARAGSARSPIWRSGGVTFGPRPGSRGLKFNKKARKQVLTGLVVSAIESDRVLCLDATFPSEKGPFVPRARDLLKKAGVIGKKAVLFLSRSDEFSYFAFRNMPTIDVVFYDQPSVITLSTSKQWLFLKKDKDQFEGMIGR